MAHITVQVLAEDLLNLRISHALKLGENHFQVGVTAVCEDGRKGRVLGPVFWSGVVHGAGVPFGLLFTYLCVVISGTLSCRKHTPDQP